MRLDLPGVRASMLHLFYESDILNRGYCVFSMAAERFLAGGMNLNRIAIYLAQSEEAGLAALSVARGAMV